MKCYYEVLNIPRDASDLDIKSAYRKLALKWHPDKNLENAELAKEQFQIVQQAYEVLSDRQERAWYDNHREQILRGSNSDFEDKSLDVFHYFNTSCFNGYGDDEKGFYSIYRNVFEDIAKEDMEFMENKEDFCQVPSFGNSKTDHEKVAEFYNFWLNYSTKKSYVWLDPYDITGAKDRRYVKLVEKENKKTRQKAKKERNEEVRNLVAFVKKRDKRVQDQRKIQEQKLQENKKKRELLSKQKRLERQQELSECCDQPEWCKFDNVKSELEAIEKNLAEQFGEEIVDSEDDEQDMNFNNLYCIACNKVFKTSKAFENHELSKKHKENVILLKEVMLNENDCEEEFYVEVDDDLDANSEEALEEDINHDDFDVIDNMENKSKKKKKPRNVLSVDMHENYTTDLNKTDPEFESNKNSDFTFNKKKKNKNKKNSDKTKPVGETVTELENMREEIKKNKGNKKKKESEDKLLDIDTDHSCITCKSNFPSKNKLFDHLKKTRHGVYIPSNARNKKKNLN